MRGRDFIERLKASRLERGDGGPRFDVFMSTSAGDDMVQWAATKAGEPAYPAVTCRQLHKQIDGGWTQTRKMRCDADRVACDALFTEFTELDNRLTAAIAAKAEAP